MPALVFSLGPVQNFIAQSRRSADGWVGSFLLSYLGCHAALALGQEGKVVEPAVEDIQLYQAVQYTQEQRQLPPAHHGLTIAGLPNNIVVEYNTDTNPQILGARAQEAVQAAWRDVATSLWAVVAPLCGDATGPRA